MLGRPSAQNPSAEKNWTDMFFHQKLLHLVDHAADMLFEKVHYWIPVVGVGMTVSLLLFGAENPVGELLSLTIPVLGPIPQQTVFGREVPGRGGGGGEESEEDAELVDDD